MPGRRQKHIRRKREEEEAKHYADENLPSAVERFADEFTRAMDEGARRFLADPAPPAMPVVAEPPLPDVSHSASKTIKDFYRALNDPNVDHDAAFKLFRRSGNDIWDKLSGAMKGMELHIVLDPRSKCMVVDTSWNSLEQDASKPRVVMNDKAQITEAISGALLLGVLPTYRERDNLLFRATDASGPALYPGQRTGPLYSEPGDEDKPHFCGLTLPEWIEMVNATSPDGNFARKMRAAVEHLFELFPGVLRLAKRKGQTLQQYCAWKNLVSEELYESVWEQNAQSILAVAKQKAELKQQRQALNEKAIKLQQETDAAKRTAEDLARRNFELTRELELRRDRYAAAEKRWDREEKVLRLRMEQLLEDRDEVKRAGRDLALRVHGYGKNIDGTYVADFATANRFVVDARDVNFWEEEDQPFILPDEPDAADAVPALPYVSREDIARFLSQRALSSFAPTDSSESLAHDTYAPLTESDRDEGEGPDFQGDVGDADDED